MDRVLERKFNVPQNKRKEFEQTLLINAEIVFPIGDLQVVKNHPSDNVVLETAIIGQADVLVTGDKHLLDVGKFRELRIEKAGKL